MPWSFSPATEPIVTRMAASTPNWPRFLVNWTTASPTTGSGTMPGELVAADRRDDLLDVAREDRRDHAQDGEEDDDDGQAQGAHLLAQLLADEQPEAVHRPSGPVVRRRGSTALSAPTSCRKTSSSVGRTRSKRASRTPAATTIGQRLGGRQLGVVAPTPG